MNKEQLLYRYFSNSLSAEDEKQLQDLLEFDVEFKEQFNFEKDLKRVVREGEKAKLKGKLQGFESETSKEKPVIQLNQHTNKRSFNWSIAASVAILFGLGWFGYQTFSGTDHANLYDANFEEYPNTVYAITRGNTSETTEREAFVAYESGDYETAISGFRKMNSEENKSYIDFYIGQSQLSLNQLDEAKKSFQQIIASGSDFIPEGLWYLALIEVKKENSPNAIIHLKKLVADYDYNKDRAKALLEELE